MSTSKPRVKKAIKKWIAPPGLWAMLAGISATLRPANSAGAPVLFRDLLEENKSLADRHAGERCFILGAGSSIAKQDLKKLQSEHVISVSNTFVHPDYSLIKPRYHVLPPIVHGHGSLYPKQKYVEWLRQMDSATGEAEMFLHIGDKDLIDSNDLFKNRCIHWNEYVEWNRDCNFGLDLSCVPSIGSVSEYAITVALYLGFEKIYLLGFDHDWYNGLFVYFYDHKTQHSMAPDEKAMPLVDSEFQMRRHADIFRKYKCLYQMKKNIYNANADALTYLDTFPCVNYESLFLN